MATETPSQQRNPNQAPSSVSTCSLLTLPLELRLQIYHHALFLPAQHLTVRSHFIRQGFRNVFMIQQQPLSLSQKHENGGDSLPAVGLLLTNRQIHTEASPVLYAAPRWACGCRAEALASQIGHVNFGWIRNMSLDVDDLDLVVECARAERQRRVHRGSFGFTTSFPHTTTTTTVSSSAETGSISNSKRLDFSNLEVLEVEGYQSAALLERRSSSHRVRIEALRLCELAAQLIGVHPQLKTLLQKNHTETSGGADARDMSLGRVRWRFVATTAVPTSSSITATEIDDGVDGDDGDDEEAEHVVDLHHLRSTLESMLKEDERLAMATESEFRSGSGSSSLPVAWTSSATGRFHLYPFSQTA